MIGVDSGERKIKMLLKKKDYLVGAIARGAAIRAQVRR